MRDPDGRPSPLGRTSFLKKTGSGYDIGMATCTELRTGEREFPTWGPTSTRVRIPAGREQEDVKRVALFGVRFDRVSLPEALGRIERWIEEGPPRRARLVVTPDTTALMRARRDPLLRWVYHQADLVTPDGAGIVWASRCLRTPLKERVSGIDLVEELFRRSAMKGYRFFFLGAKPGVAQAAARRTQKRYPGLQIVGTHHGYFSPQEEPLLLEGIHAARPDVLLVGLGVPKQELWMLRNRAALEVPVMIGVGGSLDVLSGRLPRAPKSWQQLGLEWLWRVLREPQRLGRVRTIPQFMALVLLQRALSSGPPV